MKIRLTLIAIVVSFLLASNAAMADNDKGNGNGRPEAAQARKAIRAMADKVKVRGKPNGNYGAFPEISVASGTSAIALLTGVLLLGGERTRTRRT